MDKKAAKKKTLPARTLSKGDTVRFRDLMGVVSGDSLSPGGMRDHVEVTFFVAFHGDQGMYNYVRRFQIPIQDLTYVKLPLLEFTPAIDGDMRHATGYILYQTAGD